MKQERCVMKYMYITVKMYQCNMQCYGDSNLMSSGLRFELTAACVQPFRYAYASAVNGGKNDQQNLCLA
jgi:hypothetical protein